MPPAVVVGGDAVLARFEGGVVTGRDFQAALANKAPLVRQALDSPEARARFLRALVDYELLLHEAGRRGYAEHQVVRDAVAIAAIDQMTMRDLVPAPASIPAEEVAGYFEKVRGRFAVPATRRVSHILVGTETEARVLLRELYSADDAAFARAAVEHTMDAHTRDQGGGFGYLTRDGRRADGTELPSVPREVLDAVFQAPEQGVLREPVRHAAGFSIVMVTGEIAESQPALTALESRLRAEMAEARETEALAALTAKLEAELKPVVHAALVDRVVVDETHAPDIPAGFSAAPPDPREPTVLVPPEDD